MAPPCIRTMGRASRHSRRRKPNRENLWLKSDLCGNIEEQFNHLHLGVLPYLARACNAGCEEGEGLGELFRCWEVLLFAIEQRTKEQNRASNKSFIVAY